MEKIKTKVRFTSLDVAAMVQNLQRLIGMRATNIYDLNPSTYIIKLAKSQDKVLILIENGVRFHTIDEKTDKKEIPSGFTMKFRKFLRSKRLQSIRQVGVERVVVFTFGTEAYTNHLILQLYAQGNIILTDSDYKILQCIRSHEFNDKVKTAVGEIYPFQHAANIYLENIDISIPKIEQILNQGSQKPEEDPEEGQKKKKKNANKKQNTKLKDVVFKLIPCLFPAVIDNILTGEKINPDQQASQQNIQAIEQACKVNFKFLKQFLKSKHTGFLYCKKQVAEKEDKQYFEYSPYKNIKFSEAHAEFKFDSFDAAVAEYYAKYKKSQHQEEEQFEELAWKKYEQIKKDQEARVKKLQQEQDLSKVKAQYIQKNLEDVEAIIKIVKTMEDNGYSWEAIQRMVLQSKKNGDPLANMIHELNIMKRQVTVLLGDPSSQEQLFQLLPVQINIDYNAYTNATLYYENKKKNYQKELRTKEASEQVLKIAEKDALKIIERKKNEQFSKNIPTRRQFWFEKFYWFISSEGVLVISGRDSHQNEILVKRYMKSGDLYMHSDYGGAASTVIKISSKQLGIPRTTLQQAAVFTVCRSKAWDTKILSGAWWVYHDQVSKSAPTGEYLPTGSFMIRGKRNFLQPNRMEMGITFLFKIDNQSAKRHMNDRKIHQQQLKQEQKQSQPVQAQIKESEADQFAIVSAEANVKQKGPKNQKNAKQQLNQLQMKKQESKKKSEIEVQKSEEENSDDIDDQSDSDAQQGKGKASKKPVQQQKQKGKNEENQPKQKTRNKKKLKKLEKYLQQQDEQEREIIMKMIGARQMKHRVNQEQVQQGKGSKGKGKNKNKKKGIEKYIGEQKNTESEEKLNPDKVLFFKKNEGKNQKVSSNSDEQSDKGAEQKQQEKAEVPQTQQKAVTNVSQISQQNIQQKKEKENQEGQNQESQQNSSGEEEEAEKEGENKEEKGETKKQEDEEVDEKVLDSELAQLFKLVGKVHPQDKIENLVAMCAPYNSMKDNRFKIKLVPGGLKKGKAARNILHFFLNSGQLNEVEKLLVRNIPQQQIINVLLGNVKLAGAGLLKLEQKQKAQKKTKRKQNEKKQKNN